MYLDNNSLSDHKVLCSAFGISKTEKQFEIIMKGVVWNTWMIFADQQSYFILTHALLILCTPVSPRGQLHASQWKLDVEPWYVCAQFCEITLWILPLLCWIEWTIFCGERGERFFDYCCNIMKDMSLKQEQCVVLESSCKSSRCELLGSCAIRPFKLH